MPYYLCIVDQQSKIKFNFLKFIIMSEEKTYVFDGGSGNMLASLAPLLKGNGIDPNVLLAMNNGGMGGMNGGG
jgi:hypothetical protein